MPLCTVDGQNGSILSYFHDKEYFNPKKTVIIGGRDIEKPEYDNLVKAGVTVFTTEDIKKLMILLKILLDYTLVMT